MVRSAGLEALLAVACRAEARVGQVVGHGYCRHRVSPSAATSADGPSRVIDRCPIQVPGSGLGLAIWKKRQADDVEDVAKSGGGDDCF
eukprot:3032120-Rhodomonas_salina.1